MVVTPAVLHNQGPGSTLSQHCDVESIALVRLANKEMSYWLSSRVHCREDAGFLLDSPMGSVLCFRKAE